MVTQHDDAQSNERTGLSLSRESRFFLTSRAAEKGGVIFYIFLAIALLAALTYSFTKDSHDNVAVQIANKTAQELYVQVNLVRSAVVECTLAWPGGGPDVDVNGTVETTENPNNPYPLIPTDAQNPGGAAADDSVRNLSCIGAPTGKTNIFQGAGNQGRFLPPPPAGFGQWLYVNDSSGVRIKISTTSSSDLTGLDALNRLMTRFTTCQADLNYGGCGTHCFTAWIQRTACP